MTPILDNFFNEDYLYIVQRLFPRGQNFFHNYFQPLFKCYPYIFTKMYFQELKRAPYFPNTGSISYGGVNITKFSNSGLQIVGN